MTFWGAIRFWGKCGVGGTLKCWGVVDGISGALKCQRKGVLCNCFTYCPMPLSHLLSIASHTAHHLTNCITYCPLPH